MSYPMDYDKNVIPCVVVDQDHGVSANDFIRKLDQEGSLPNMECERSPASTGYHSGTGSDDGYYHCGKDDHKV